MACTCTPTKSNLNQRAARPSVLYPACQRHLEAISRSRTRSRPCLYDYPHQDNTARRDSYAKMNRGNLVLRMNRSHVKMNRASYASNGKAEPAATQPKEMRAGCKARRDRGKSTASRPHRTGDWGIRERRAMLLLLLLPPSPLN
jgi:hypothetical protein